MFSLTSKQKEQLSAISDEFALNFIVLFGSYAQKYERQGSDIDIAVSTEERLDYRQEFLLKKALQSVFAAAEVDLAQVSDASPLFLYHIAFKSELLYERTKQSFSYFQMYAFKRYVEARPLYALQKMSLAK